MLHFFRRIRQRLLRDNKFTKYMLYAIGEIILVVIGILIALYINNRNEQRKERERFDMVLVDVERELIDNISWVRFVSLDLALLDSLYLKYFIDSVIFEDNFVYPKLFGGFYSNSIRDDSFQKLTELNNLSKEQESLLNELIGLNRRETYLDEQVGIILDMYDKREEKLKGYDWYEKWKFRQYDDERIIDFFVNDPECKKLVVEHFEQLARYNWGLMRYNYFAVPVYDKVHKYLDSLEVKRSDSLVLTYDPDDYEHYLGEYKVIRFSDERFNPEDYSITVSIDKDKLKYTVSNSNESDQAYEIIPINKNRFRIIDKSESGSFHLDFDDQGEVKGGRYVNGTFMIAMNKVR